jgi:opacity protein-like surface antigen
MQRQFCAVFIFLLLSSLNTFAQDHPKAEVFGGYQYTRVNPEGSGTGFNFNGWNAALTGNVNKWFGITADFSGAYKTISGVSVKAHTYTFGPTIFVRGNENFTPFVHALFGGFHGSAGFQSLSASTNGFAMFVGGGLDVKATDHLALRVGQFDWALLHAEGSSEKKNFRYSGGIVFRF